MREIDWIPVYAVWSFAANYGLPVAVLRHQEIIHCGLRNESVPSRLSVSHASRVFATHLTDWSLPGQLNRHRRPAVEPTHRRFTSETQAHRSKRVHSPLWPLQQTDHS